MLLGIGAQDAPPAPAVAEEVAKTQEEAPIAADITDAVDTDRQGGDDIGEAPPGADMDENAEADEDEEFDEDEPEEDAPEDEDEELDEDEPEEFADEDVPPEELAAIKAEQEKMMKEASDKSEETVAPVSEVKTEA